MASAAPPQQKPSAPVQPEPSSSSSLPGLQGVEDALRTYTVVPVEKVPFEEKVPEHINPQATTKQTIANSSNPTGDEAKKVLASGASTHPTEVRQISILNESKEKKLLWCHFESGDKPWDHSWMRYRQIASPGTFDIDLEKALVASTSQLQVTGNAAIMNTGTCLCGTQRFDNATIQPDLANERTATCNVLADDQTFGFRIYQTKLGEACSLTPTGITLDSYSMLKGGNLASIKPMTNATNYFFNEGEVAFLAAGLGTYMESTNMQNDHTASLLRYLLMYAQFCEEKVQRTGPNSATNDTLCKYYRNMEYRQTNAVSQAAMWWPLGTSDAAATVIPAFCCGMDSFLKHIRNPGLETWVAAAAPVANMKSWGSTVALVPLTLEMMTTWPDAALRLWTLMFLEYPNYTKGRPRPLTMIETYSGTSTQLGANVPIGYRGFSVAETSKVQGPNAAILFIVVDSTSNRINDGSVASFSSVSVANGNCVVSNNANPAGVNWGANVANFWTASDERVEAAFDLVWRQIIIRSPASILRTAAVAFTTAAWNFPRSEYVWSENLTTRLARTTDFAPSDAKYGGWDPLPNYPVATQPQLDDLGRRRKYRCASDCFMVGKFLASEVKRNLAVASYTIPREGISLTLDMSGLFAYTDNPTPAIACPTIEAYFVGLRIKAEEFACCTTRMFEKLGFSEASLFVGNLNTPSQHEVYRGLLNTYFRDELGLRMHCMIFSAGNTNHEAQDPQSTDLIPNIVSTPSNVNVFALRNFTDADSEPPFPSTPDSAPLIAPDMNPYMSRVTLPLYWPDLRQYLTGIVNPELVQRLRSDITELAVMCPFRLTTFAAAVQDNSNAEIKIGFCESLFMRFEGDPSQIGNALSLPFFPENNYSLFSGVPRRFPFLPGLLTLTSDYGEYNVEKNMFFDLDPYAPNHAKYSAQHVIKGKVYNSKSLQPWQTSVFTSLMSMGFVGLTARSLKRVTTEPSIGGIESKRRQPAQGPAAP